MGIQNQMKKLMVTTIGNFAQDDGVKPDEIDLMIHTKNPEFLPEFFYLVRGKPKRTEDGEIKQLVFLTDILRKKFDALNKEHYMNVFMQFRLQVFNKAFDIEQQRIYVKISLKNENKSDVNIDLYEDQKFIKRFTVKEVFEME